MAHGQRAVPKLISILQHEGLPLEKLDQALVHLKELLITPEQRSRAVDAGVVQLCVDLLIHTNDGIRIGALEVVNAVASLREACDVEEFKLCLENVLENLGHEAMLVRQHALHVLTTVARHFRGRQVVFSIADSIEKIASALPDCESHVANEYGLEALTQLSQEAFGVEAALKAGCISIAFKALTVSASAYKAFII